MKSNTERNPTSTSGLHMYGHRSVHIHGEQWEEEGGEGNRKKRKMNKRERKKEEE